MDTQTRFYTERSNARRAARAASVDPDTVFETPDGFTFKPADATDAPSAKDDELAIPAALKFSPEERKQAWIENPPKAKPVKETAMAKPKKPAEKEKKTSGADKTAKLIEMLQGKGATVEELTKATDWLPHTLRARISHLCKAKTAGGLGMDVKRERVDGVTTYYLG